MAYKLHSFLGGSLSLILGLCLLFWLIPAWVEPDDYLRLPVSFVPQVVAIGFILCGGLMMVQAIWAHTHKKDKGEIKTGFDPGEFKGLAMMVALLLVGTLGFQFFHFLIVAPVLVAISMWMFGALRPVSFVLTVILGPLLIWVIATHILGRVVP